MQELLGLLVDMEHMEVRVGSRRVRAYLISIDVAALGAAVAQTEAAAAYRRCDVLVVNASRTG